MKKIILLLLVAIFFVGCMPLKMVTEIKYETLIEMPGKRKTELYGMSNEWMVSQFVDPRSIIQFSNLETGTISGKYTMFYQAPTDFAVEIVFYSIITIRIKDYKVQISIDPQGSLPRTMVGVQLYSIKQMEAESKRLISSYENFMKVYVKF